MANVLIPKKSTVAGKVPTTSDLAHGEIAVNFSDQKIFGRDPSSGTIKELGGAAGSLSIDTTAADLFSASSGSLTADDPGADRLFFWDDSAGRATHLEVGSGLAITGTTLSNTGGLSGTGSVDNAILRADGTGGSTLQNSGLVVEDTIVSFTTITGDASTDIITATGSAFANAQPVRFTVLAGGTGLNTTTNYFVRDVSGSTFKLETSIGGGAINFTANITSGTLLTGHSVTTNVTLSENTTATNSDLVLTPKGTGAFILGPKPDGTATGGNARGASAIDLQVVRSTNAQVASAQNSAIIAGSACTASNSWAIAGGRTNTASNQYAVAVGGQDNIASGFISTLIGGFRNKASTDYTGALGSFYALADRYAMQAHAGGRFAADGDAQRARFVMRTKTTTNIAVELFLDGSSARLTIPSGKVVALTINICGISSTGAAVAHYMRQYALKNVSGTTSEVYAPITIGTDNAAGTSLALSASDASDALTVSVTGTASTIWRWVASVDAVEIAFGT